jgi:hypothetical protein
MAVVRPDDLVTVDVEIEFNFLYYNKIEIDLEHINRGKSNTREAGYRVDEVTNIVKSLLDGAMSDVYTKKYYGDDCCTYFSIHKTLEDKHYKIVFCYCSDRKETLGIITLHRLRR